MKQRICENLTILKEFSACFFSQKDFLPKYGFFIVDMNPAYALVKLSLSKSYVLKID